MAYKPTATKKWPSRDVANKWPTPTEDWHIESIDEGKKPGNLKKILFIAGITVGAITIVAIIAVIGFLLYKRRKYRYMKKNTDIEDLDKVMLDHSDPMP